MSREGGRRVSGTAPHHSRPTRVYKQGVRDPQQMGNLPKALRTLLEQHTSVGTLECDTELVSKDGTVKRAYRLPDGQLIESVLMPYADGRRTACISSQAGCGMGCTFCATGQMGFARHLSSTEIYEQAQRFAAELQQRDPPERLSVGGGGGRGGGPSS